jgi:hypothetical protein
MGPPGGLRQGLLEAADELALGPLPLPLDALEAETFRPTPRDHDEVNPFGQDSGVPPKTLPAQPLNPVTDHGIPDLSGHHDPEAYRAVGRLRRRARYLPRHEQHEMRHLDAASARLNAQKVCALLQPFRPWKGVSERPGRHSYFL